MKQLEEIIYHLLLGNVDGHNKRVDGWHIDWCDQIGGQIEGFRLVNTWAHRLHIPWQVYLKIFLKSAPGLSQVIGSSDAEMDHEVAPEVIVYAGDLIVDFGGDVRPQGCSWVPGDWRAYLVERYDQEDGLYNRSLFCRVVVFEKEELRLQSCDSFSLALQAYYFDHDIDGGLSLLEIAIGENSNRGECYLFRYLLSCIKYQSIEYRIADLDKAMQLEPQWVLPKIQLLKYLLYQQNFDQMRIELRVLSELISQIENGEIESGNDFWEKYVSGNALDARLVVNGFSRIIDLYCN
jgi:hypothetical protein